MLTLTSCDNYQHHPRAYVSTDITYSESTAQYGFRLNMDSTETEFAIYYFESGIDNKDRESCIETTDNFLAEKFLDGVIPEIYIFSKEQYDYKYISDHKLYSSVQNWRAVEYLTDVLLAAYGESVHYGTAFGYANYYAA